MKCALRCTVFGAIRGGQIALVVVSANDAPIKGNVFSVGGQLMPPVHLGMYIVYVYMMQLLPLRVYVTVFGVADFVCMFCVGGGCQLCR